MSKVLVVDDDAAVRDLVRQALEEASHTVVTAGSLSDGIRAAQGSSFEAVLLDIRLPDGSGIGAMPRFHRLASQPAIIIMTAYGGRADLEKAFSQGAFDFLVKPVAIADLVGVVDRALANRALRQAFGTKVLDRPSDHGLVGTSPPMRKVLEQLELAAPSPASVLIVGETGTGKGVLARAIHARSPRHCRPFVTVDCAALPESLVEGILFGHERGAFTSADRARPGLVQQADGGTLFLDEVGELPLSLQKTFLRVLQERNVLPLGGKQEIPVDFRLIAASNRNLADMTAMGAFRSDLFFRLRTIEIRMPALREHREDIRDLVRYHAARLCKRYGMPDKAFSPAFFTALEHHEWPGNVRELVHLLEQVLTMNYGINTVDDHDLPTQIRVSARLEALAKVVPRGDGMPVAVPAPGSSEAFPRFQDARSAMERQYLEELLRAAAGSRKKACQLSGLSRTRIFELLRKHDLLGHDARSL
ncbi:MAG: sigma-54 dependent transcriptional regulator [Thermodesulfobacteriota bacterium]